MADRLSNVRSVELDVVKRSHGKHRPQGCSHKNKWDGNQESVPRQVYTSGDRHRADDDATNGGRYRSVFRNPILKRRGVRDTKPANTAHKSMPSLN